MNYGQIRKYDVANGPGIRTSFFLTGCDRNCKNCFNKDYMDFNYGKVWDELASSKIIDYLSLEEVEGLTVLGGEPFENILGLSEVINKIRKYSQKSIWVYTGFTFEVLANIPLARKLLEQIDVLVDGEFIEEKKDLKLKFRGSSNQRIIDVRKSLDSNEIIWLDGYK